MKTARQILEEKNKKPTVIAPDRTVLEALRLMAETDVGAVMVVSAEKLVGVVSERDFVRKVALKGLNADALVRDVMTTDVVAVPPDHTVADCMTLMTQKHIRHLPVLDGGRLVGVISVRDVVKATLEEKEYLIDQLTGYISGR